MKRIFRIIPWLFVCSAIGWLLGCDPKDLPDGTADELQKKLTQNLEKVLRHSDVPVKELEKLQQREYTIVKLPLDGTPEKIEGTLNEFGKNRWDCFDVEKAAPTAEEPAGSLVVFCKRMPETPLRYVPQSLIGR